MTEYQYTCKFEMNSLKIRLLTSLIIHTGNLEVCVLWGIISTVKQALCPQENNSAVKKIYRTPHKYYVLQFHKVPCLDPYVLYLIVIYEFKVT